MKQSDRAQRLTDRVDAAILRQIARLRTDWLTDVFDRVDRFASGWGITVVAIGLLIALMVFRRWRHLFTFVGSVARPRVARASRSTHGSPARARTTSRSSGAGGASRSRRRRSRV